MATNESTAPAPQADFMAMRNVLMLAAFAAEARRVLEDIEHVADSSPEIDRELSSRIQARRQWSMYEDTVPEVLEDVARQLEALTGKDE